MRYELQVVSFLCGTLLAILLSLPRIRGNIANLAIVGWLLTCNLIQGINAVIWAGNVDIRVPVWCDIVSRVLVGAFVALPGACICMSGRMELLSSKRRIADDLKSQQARLLIELTFCYIIPVVYILLYLIAQDHRFNLTKDYGCTFSIFPSGPTLAVMSIPPLLLCAISFALSGRAIHNSCLTTASEFGAYIESRAPISVSIFVRRIGLSLFLTGVIFIMSLFNIFVINDFVPWISFADAHKNMWEIQVLNTADESAPLRARWWLVPVVSIAYILFMFTLGDEVREGFKLVRDRVTKMKKPRFEKSILPLHLVKGRGRKNKGHTIIQDTAPAPRPLTLTLRSGWDDMLDEPVSPSSRNWSLSGKKTPSVTRCKTPALSSRTPSPLPRLNTNLTDDAFIASTLDYVTSPTAKSLGIGPSHSPLSPPPVYFSTLQTRLDANVGTAKTVSPPIYHPPASAHADANPFRSSSPRQQHPSSPDSPSSMLPPAAPFTRQADDMPPTPQSIPKDVDSESIVSSVLDDSWPQPPLTPATPSLRTVPSLVLSPNRRYPVSPTHSVDTSVSTVWSVQDDAHGRGMPKPVQGRGVTPPLAVVPKLVIPHPKKQRSLQRMLSIDSRYSTCSDDAVYMDMIRETAV